MKVIAGVKCRSAIESLEHIIKRAKAGKIGPTKKDRDEYKHCAYKYPSGNNCAVGCLFSKDQLKDICNKNVNGNGVVSLARVIGAHNLETVTGMDIPSLLLLQKAHDDVVNEGKKPTKTVIAQAKLLMKKYKGIK